MVILTDKKSVELKASTGNEKKVTLYAYEIDDESCEGCFEKVLKRQEKNGLTVIRTAGGDSIVLPRKVVT